MVEEQATWSGPKAGGVVRASTTGSRGTAGAGSAAGRANRGVSGRAAPAGHRCETKRERPVWQAASVYSPTGSLLLAGLLVGLLVRLVADCC
jgi:hypothetical protein